MICKDIRFIKKLQVAGYRNLWRFPIFLRHEASIPNTQFFCTRCYDNVHGEWDSSSR